MARSLEDGGSLADTAQDCVAADDVCDVAATLTGPADGLVTRPPVARRRRQSAKRRLLCISRLVGIDYCVSCMSPRTLSNEIFASHRNQAFGRDAEHLLASRKCIDIDIPCIPLELPALELLKLA